MRRSQTRWSDDLHKVLSGVQLERPMYSSGLRQAENDDGEVRTRELTWLNRST